MALSKQKIKFIRSLGLKKYRRQAGLFVAEGTKLVLDLLEGGMHCRLLVATPDWLATHRRPEADTVIEADERELQQASWQKTPQGVLALMCLPADDDEPPVPTGELTLALDGVQDPGNLGTILRAADWFGISRVICSPATADAFAPKAVQAAMGAIAGVRVCYTDLPVFLTRCRTEQLPVYGTFMDGESLYAPGTLTPHGVVVMGSEGQGISPAVARCVSRRIGIPRFAQGGTASESLNVAMAAAIVCAEFRRHSLEQQFPKTT